jgi:cyclohexadienyl dehydratase
LLALLLAALGCAAGGVARDGGGTGVPVTAVLRVGTSGDYPPFSVRSADGALDGFDVAVARAYARDRGRSIALTRFAWPELERRLLAGDFDVAMSGVTVRGDRLARAPMTAAVARTSAVLIVAGGDDPGRAAASPGGAGLVVAVNRGGHLEDVARRRLPQATLVAIDDNRSLPEVLASGRVDAVVTDTLELSSFAAAGRSPPRVVRVLSHDRKAYWVAPRSSDLVDDFDVWLATRETDGTLDALRASYGLAPSDASPRGGLDTATARVVDLVARRLLLMPQVAAAKHAASAPVDAPERERVVYEKARHAAAGAGLDATAYVALVREEVEIAKDVQRAVLERLADAKRPPADEAAAREARGRLEHELRPAIDRLDAGIRSELVAAAPIRLDRDRLAAAILRDAPVPGFTIEQARRLAQALRAIPAAAPDREIAS